MAAALVSNSDFAANFSVSYVDPTPDTGKLTPLGGTVAAGKHLVGGMSSVGVVVKFNDAIETLANDGADIANAIRPAASTVVGTVNWVAPDNTVHITYTSASMAALPARAGFRVIPAQAATSYNGDANGDGTADDDVTSIREILNSLRPDSSIKPAPPAA